MDRAKAVWAHSNRGPSPKTNPARSLIWEFQSPEMRGNKCLWFKPPSLWCLQSVWPG